jgi:hypothetical protein
MSITNYFSPEDALEELRGNPPKMVLVLALRADRPIDPAYRFLVGEKSFVVGRGSEIKTVPLSDTQTSLLLPDLSTSRKHAELRLDSERPGALTVTDLGSTNGVCLQGKGVAYAHMLPGEVLEIGSCFFVLAVTHHPVEPTSCIAFTSTTCPDLEALIAVRCADPRPLALIGETGVGAQLVAEDLHLRRRAQGSFVTWQGGPFVAAQQRAEGGTVFVPDIESLNAAELTELEWALAAGNGPRLVVAVGQAGMLNVLGARGAALAERAVVIPALADRRHDIGRLISRALDSAARRAGRDPHTLSLSRGAARAFMFYDWPGGFGELQLACDHAVANLTGEVIGRENLPAWLGRADEDMDDDDAPASQTLPMEGEAPTGWLLSGTPAERASTLRALLAVFGGNVSALARWVGRSRRQVHRWIREAEIDVGEIRRA